MGSKRAPQVRQRGAKGSPKRGKRGPERQLERKRAKAKMCKNLWRVVPKSTWGGARGSEKEDKRGSRRAKKGHQEGSDAATTPRSQQSREKVRSGGGVKA